jgi:hypothetical protein
MDNDLLQSTILDLTTKQLPSFIDIGKQNRSITKPTQLIQYLQSSPGNLIYRINDLQYGDIITIAQIEYFTRTTVSTGTARRSL